MLNAFKTYSWCSLWPFICSFMYFCPRDRKTRNNNRNVLVESMQLHKSHTHKHNHLTECNQTANMFWIVRRAISFLWSWQMTNWTQIITSCNNICIRWIFSHIEYIVTGDKSSHQFLYSTSIYIERACIYVWFD